MIEITVLHDKYTPRRSKPMDAGFDVRARLDGSVILAPGARVKVPLGFSVALLPDTAGLLWPRSGLASTYGVQVLGGLIDPNYRGEVQAILYNSGDDPVRIEDGDRVAQLLIVRIPDPRALPELEVVAALSESERGADGFGSTGKD